MFTAFARSNGEGLECPIGATSANQPMVRMYNSKLGYRTTVRLQELLGLIHPGKNLQTTVDRVVMMVTETAVDGALYALSKQQTSKEEATKESAAMQAAGCRPSHGPFPVGVCTGSFRVVDMDWPLSGWGYGLVPFHLGIGTGPFLVGDRLIPMMISLILLLGAMTALVKAGFMSLCHSLEETEEL